MIVTNPNLAQPDAAYALLLASHEGLSEQESHALNAMLVLLLMNHLGDLEVIGEALKIAKNTIRDPSKK